MPVANQSKKTKTPSAEVPSPCVGICTPDERDICMGCMRTMEEVTKWWDMSNDDKRELLKKLPSRSIY